MLLGRGARLIVLPRLLFDRESDAIVKMWLICTLSGQVEDVFYTQRTSLYLYYQIHGSIDCLSESAWKKSLKIDQPCLVRS